ncbi:transcription factor Ouib-like [Bactrocera neohumeralis]|uniref:transcription factor Ouib-like n=1 Tax=Bactrocera tryoni TaxID=59916 RepID=UPI001A9653AA|nr:transcription factor Ouib-like [Bactrocera tryoni]XP_050341184.1 transcription factor Ouib-like [Bactrocera neohumeralis]
MHVYDLCRICLTEDINTSKMQPLFETEDDTCNEIVQQIEVCGGIVLKPHEEFPKMICVQCLEKLNVSFKFRSMCQASEHALLDAIVKSEMKTEPLDYEGAQIISKHEEDNEDEMFFDMHTEFIDAQEVHLEDITETVEEEVLESDMEPNTESAEEFIEYTDSEYFEEELPKSIIKKTATPTYIQRQPVTSDNLVRKRGRPKTKPEGISLKSELHSGKKSNRGRKKKEEPEVASIMCEICGNIYSKRNLLKMHMRRHMAEKPFECEICGKTFACPSEIGRHMRVHTGEKPYICKYCGRTFADRSTNIKHERIHTNERPFTCQTCGKSFTYSNVLKNHMLTHTGEKPFPCIPCNKTFSRKHQLDQHIATITHQQTVRNLTTTDVKVQHMLQEDEPNQHVSNINHHQTLHTISATNIKVEHLLQQFNPNQHITTITQGQDDRNLSVSHMIEEEIDQTCERHIEEVDEDAEQQDSDVYINTE